MKLLLLPLAALVLLALAFTKTLTNSPEQQTAVWNDGTDAFYKQVIKHKGDWLKDVGQAIFDNQSVNGLSKADTDSILARAKESQDQVLGLHTAPDGAEKWIEIDLSDLKLFAWEGSRKIYEFSISTGRPGYETPTGEFRVWRKVLSQTYKGGSKARVDYYYLPNVPFSLFFGGGDVPNWKGYAIHGAYWHNDFGIKNRSSGCVNVKPEEAGLLYNWAGPAMPGGVNALNATTDNPGVRVVIHE